jgi:sugar lactone lactonase YvrE
MALPATDGITLLARDMKSRTTLANPIAGRPNISFNDAKCDRQGRLWTGTILAHHSANLHGQRLLLYPADLLPPEPKTKEARLIVRDVATLSAGAPARAAISFRKCGSPP